MPPRRSLQRLKTDVEPTFVPIQEAKLPAFEVLGMPTDVTAGPNRAPLFAGDDDSRVDIAPEVGQR